MSTDIESAFRGLKQVLTNVAAGSSALPSVVRRNASLRDMFGQISGTSKAYLNLIDDDPVLYDTIIGPGGDYYEEFGQRGVVEFIVMEVDDAIRDAVFAEGLAELAKGLRLAKEQLPLLSAMDVLPPERANLAAGPLPGIKAARITIEWLITAPDMLGNVLADRATAVIESITMSGDILRITGPRLVGVIDPIVAASQAAALLQAQIATGIDAVLGAGSSAVRVAAAAAPGIAAVLGSGDADLVVGVSGAGLVGNILGAGDATVPSSGFGGMLAIDPVLGSGDAAAKVSSAMSGMLDAIVGSGAVFTNSGANASGWIEPILGTGDIDLQISGQTAGLIEGVLGSGAIGLEIQAIGGGIIEAILSSGQAGVPQAVLIGGGSVEPVLGIGDASAVVSVGLGGLLDPIVAAGAGAIAVDASSGTLLDPILGQGDATQRNTADASGNVEAILSSGDVDSRVSASTSGSIMSILGSGGADVVVGGASAGIVGAILGTGAGSVVGGGNEAETDAFLARMTVAPSTGREGVINAFIKGLKDDGLWDEFDAFKVYFAHHEQASTLCWKDNANDDVYRVGDTFVVNAGVDNDSSDFTGWPTGVTLSTHASAMTSTQGHVGVWVQNMKTSGFSFLGADSGVNSYELGKGGTTANVKMGSSPIYSLSSGVGVGPHHLVLTTQNGGANVDGYLDGVDDYAGSAARGGTLLSAGEWQLGTDNHQCRTVFFHTGGELDATQISNLHARMNTFLTDAAANP